MQARLDAPEQDLLEAVRLVSPAALQWVYQWPVQEAQLASPLLALALAFALVLRAQDAPPEGAPRPEPALARWVWPSPLQSWPAFLLQRRLPHVPARENAFEPSRPDPAPVSSNAFFSL